MTIEHNPLPYVLISKADLHSVMYVNRCEYVVGLAGYLVVKYYK